MANPTLAPSVKIAGVCPACKGSWVWAHTSEILQFCPNCMGLGGLGEVKGPKIPISHSVIVGPAPVGVPLMTPAAKPAYSYKKSYPSASQPPISYAAKVAAILEKKQAQIETANKPKKGAKPIPPVPTITFKAKTQKAKGIQALQHANILPTDMAYVALDIAQALEAGEKLGYPCFIRPCPITPRHGFVESRVVKGPEEVAQVWGEALAADPQAELILMPFVTATHNMVWRPGLLSIGPGHDGATGGHDSVSVFLEPDYSEHWKALATAAGCDLAKSDPFIEAVAGDAHPSVITQIRAGDNKPAPTSPDWNPHANLVVVKVTIIDPAHKSDPGAMLEWETTAKTLNGPAGDVVYNPGGNLGDHWSVHARLAEVPVCTTFLPVQGQILPIMGEKPVPLDPNAIVYGYLGGLLAPSLMLPVMRERAVCAALLGSHHGLRMGGDAGVFLGTSVAMMLRLAQAAIWGEARHKDGGKGLSKGLSRDQIFQAILDDWYKGRVKLEEKGALFLTLKWGSSFGGPAWAACSGATCDLDAAMLTLMQAPTEANAKQIVATLTNVVNLAHNNGWWLNKFVGSHIYDMAADLDPRIAVLAGPIWYEATKVPTPKRIALLQKIVKNLAPCSLEKYGLSKVAAKFKVSKPGEVHSLKSGSGSAHGGHGVPSTPYVPQPTVPHDGQKLGALPSVQLGGLIEIPIGVPVTGAQVKTNGHLQIKVAHGEKGKFWGYYSTEVLGSKKALLKAAEHDDSTEVSSLAGTGSTYLECAIDPVFGIIALPGVEGSLATWKHETAAEVETEEGEGKEDE